MRGQSLPRALTSIPGTERLKILGHRKSPGKSLPSEVPNLGSMELNAELGNGGCFPRGTFLLLLDPQRGHSLSPGQNPPSSAVWHPRAPDCLGSYTPLLARRALCQA